MTDNKPRALVIASHRSASVFEFHFGAYGETRLLAVASGVEEALEECAAWLAEHEPGHLVPHAEAGELDTDVDGNPIDHTYTEAGWLRSWEWSVNEQVDTIELSGVES